MASFSDADTVGGVYFRLFSTKFPGSKSLLDWEDAKDSEERILFDEDISFLIQCGRENRSLLILR